MSILNYILFVTSKYNYPDIKFNKLHSKPLTKLIIRFAKIYDIPNDIMPNVIRSKNYGALQFLMHKKYGEKSLSNFLLSILIPSNIKINYFTVADKDSWQEMVKETVPENSFSLQLELIDACAHYGDFAEGAYWAK